MKKITGTTFQYWQFENLGKECRINHFVTDRNSNIGGREFTLSYSSSPDQEEVRANRNMLALNMGVNEKNLFFPVQVHETRIVHVSSDTEMEELAATDALITSERNICISVMSADCVPILLYDTGNYVVAAVHSGWRGTAAKILEKTLHEMQRTYNTKGSDVIAGIGPSISQASYEVGREVVDAVLQAFGENNDLLISQGDGKARLDLWCANVLQLKNFGVNPSSIEVANMCTVSKNKNFFSARMGDKGRFAAGIMLV